MKNNVTELVFLLDRSGSMQGLEQDTVGGFNAMIEKQKKLSGKVYVSTVLFSNDSRVIHDRVDISEIAPLTTEDYQVGGSTALIDAIGCAIHHIANIHKYARAEDVPEHTVFVITTDGMENASHWYTASEVRQMIRKEEEKYGWEFLFLAANIDAVETARHFGIRRERTSNYRATPTGTQSLYSCVEKVITKVRKSEAVEEGWNKELEKSTDD